MNQTRTTLLTALTILAAALTGCNQQPQSTENASAIQDADQSRGSEYLLTSEPPAAAEVIAARQQARSNEPIVVVGRIGGSANPWIDGRAAFSIVDPSVKACSDIAGDNCPQPWDYCCATDELPDATALVKIIDPQGKLVATDARQLLGLKELQTVVVQGTAERDDAGNLTILASGVYVRK